MSDESNILQLATQGGLAAVLAGSFIWLVRTVGQSMVEAIKQNTAKTDEHIKVDLASHADMREDLARLDTKLDNLTTNVRRKK